MSSSVPRLRMFAGPNGSGKSTIKSIIDPALTTIYINPDDIEEEIRQRGFLDFRAYGVETTQEEVLTFFANSTLIQKANLSGQAECLRFSDGTLSFHQVLINSYFTSVAADFIRQKLLEQRVSFTFETVMSSPDKVRLLERAQQLGYRTYLYYVATGDPIINISRVQNRADMGGHNVPEDKIVSRYGRSLDLLMEAIQYSNRAYIFDNSKHGRIWLAEITDGKALEIKAPGVPLWFKKAVLDKIAR